MNEKFQGLKDVQWKFNERILQIIERAYTYAEKNPQLLICALRVIMNEETSYKTMMNNRIMREIGQNENMDDDYFEDDQMDFADANDRRATSMNSFSDSMHCEEYLILRNPGSGSFVIPKQES